jgi:hypothetical protein
LQPTANIRQLLFIERQVDRERFIIRTRSRDQLRQADSAQQAPRHAACETIPDMGHHRQTSPQRIAGRRMCGVGSVSRQRSAMRWRAKCSGEDATRLANTSRSGSTPLPLASFRRFDLRYRPHRTATRPTAPRSSRSSSRSPSRLDLVDIIEPAKHSPFLPEIVIGPIGRSIVDRSDVITTRHEAAGQTNDLSSKNWLV